MPNIEEATQQYLNHIEEAKKRLRELKANFSEERRDAVLKELMNAGVEVEKLRFYIKCLRNHVEIEIFKEFKKLKYKI